MLPVVCLHLVGGMILLLVAAAAAAAAVVERLPHLQLDICFVREGFFSCLLLLLFL